MFYFILRFIFICFVSYYVGIESGWYTAAVIMLLSVDSEMIKYCSRINERFYRKEIRTLNAQSGSTQYHSNLDLKRREVIRKEVYDRLEVLELIVQPITGNTDEQEQEHMHPENSKFWKTGTPL